MEKSKGENLFAQIRSLTCIFIYIYLTSFHICNQPCFVLVHIYDNGASFPDSVTQYNSRCQGLHILLEITFQGTGTIGRIISLIRYEFLGSHCQLYGQFPVGQTFIQVCHTEIHNSCDIHSG